MWTGRGEVHGESSQKTIAFVCVKEGVVVEVLLVQMEKVKLKKECMDIGIDNRLGEIWQTIGWGRWKRREISVVKIRLILFTEQEDVLWGGRCRVQFRKRYIWDACISSRFWDILSWSSGINFGIRGTEIMLCGWGNLRRLYAERDRRSRIDD